MAYLSLLDRRLSEGVGRLPEPFRLRQTRFVTACRQDDGGFAGRAGPSNLYYTRFALDALAVLGVAADDAVWPRAADFLRTCTKAMQHRGTGILPVSPRGVPPLVHRGSHGQDGRGTHGRDAHATGFIQVPRGQPADLPDCLSLLHSIHLVEAAGVALFCCQERRDGCLGALRDYVSRCRAPGGGYAATPGGTPGPYHAFLAALCHELLGDAMDDVAGAVDSVLSCRTADGGFAEAPSRPTGQTSPTAAAVGLLAVAGRLDAATARGAACFLTGVQAVGGGLKAHAAAPSADLLSTFTGVTTLASTGELRSLRLGPAGRFVRGLALPGGGFRATVADDAADVEYTFYGLGSLALLAEAAAG